VSEQLIGHQAIVRVKTSEHPNIIDETCERGMWPVLKKNERPLGRRHFVVKGEELPLADDVMWSDRSLG
jgi:hypothetical protein